MIEKNFEVIVKYSTNLDFELDSAFTALQQAKENSDRVVNACSVVLTKVKEEKANAIYQQCLPLLEMIDKIVDSKEYLPYFSSAHPFAETSFSIDGDGYVVNLWSHVHRNDMQRITVGIIGRNTESIFCDSLIAEKVIANWNKLPIYAYLKKDFLSKMKRVTKRYEEKAKEISDRTNEMVGQ